MCMGDVGGYAAARAVVHWEISNEARFSARQRIVFLGLDLRQRLGIIPNTELIDQNLGGLIVGSGAADAQWDVVLGTRQACAGE